MAAPLVTVPNWVPNIINPQILFITENYPKNPNATHENTYFYRTINPHGAVGGANNLLNNLCRTLGIIGASELDKLNTFMYIKNYFLIDTFPSGQTMNQTLINNTLINTPWIDAIIDDISLVSPEQIVFTCIRSNGLLLPELLKRARKSRKIFYHKIIHTPDKTGKLVFNSPSDNAYLGFDRQIKEAIHSGVLIS